MAEVFASLAFSFQLFHLLAHMVCEARLGGEVCYEPHEEEAKRFYEFVTTTDS